MIDFNQSELELLHRSTISRISELEEMLSKYPTHDKDAMMSKIRDVIREELDASYSLRNKLKKIINEK